jgi:acyl carrier protein
MESIKSQLKPLILSSLRLTDLSPQDLRDDQPLLGGDLEIDSIDVLQLILAIEKQFGIKLVSGRFDREAWESIDTLAASIQARLKEAGRA